MTIKIDQTTILTIGTRDGSLRGCLDFFCHHFSLNFHHSSLKIPKFFQTHSFGTHHLVLPLLFISKKKKKIERSRYAVGICFKKEKRKNPKSQTLWLKSERFVNLITKMPLETKLWKLKTPKMYFKCVFSFYNSSLKNQRIEWWKQKLETKSKRTSQSWVPPFLSQELWKQQIQTTPKLFKFKVKMPTLSKLWPNWPTVKHSEKLPQMLKFVF